ncbi:hypothetical protein [Paenibacillus contaminans]|uniref:Uncharacterized protein n=1 Tax=Paenibacillus contaminans TaxID=450362 RepID=A0A329MRA9_9BACL|nr:hypothetical protein [Paenibacillus contaminans]RAV22511.1 hypothetical protein DQG23_06130 [Paenibacillus contaminans]
MVPELHLFIVWEHAHYALQDIKSDIERKFTIKKQVRITWDPARFSLNLSRFYSQPLPDGSYKQHHCGTGAFTLFVVLDESPRYMEKSTSRGVSLVNANTFEAKSLYRTWTGGGHRVHATNTRAECERDLYLLLGMDCETFAKQFDQPWDGNNQHLSRDLTGTNGWASLTQYFEALNCGTEYVVLRNFEALPDCSCSEEHGDIDLLAGDLADIYYLSNAAAVFAEPYRVHYTVMIGGVPVAFDFRHIGDDYYNSSWQKSILASRILSDKGFYRPSEEHYFYSLLYHAIVHKASIGADYEKRLIGMAERLTIPGFGIRTMKDVNTLRFFMDMYLHTNGYQYTVPHDRSVYFNASYFGGA